MLNLSFRTILNFVIFFASVSPLSSYCEDLEAKLDRRLHPNTVLDSLQEITNDTLKELRDLNSLSKERGNKISKAFETLYDKVRGDVFWRVERETDELKYQKSQLEAELLELNLKATEINIAKKPFLIEAQRSVLSKLNPPNLTPYELTSKEKEVLQKIVNRSNDSSVSSIKLSDEERLICAKADLLSEFNEIRNVSIEDKELVNPLLFEFGDPPAVTAINEIREKLRTEIEKTIFDLMLKAALNTQRARTDLIIIGVQDKSSAVSEKEASRLAEWTVNLFKAREELLYKNFSVIHGRLDFAKYEIKRRHDEWDLRREANQKTDNLEAVRSAIEAAMQRNDKSTEAEHGGKNGLKQEVEIGPRKLSENRSVQKTEKEVIREIEGDKNRQADFDKKVKVKTDELSGQLWDSKGPFAAEHNIIRRLGLIMSDWVNKPNNLSVEERLVINTAFGNLDAILKKAVADVERKGIVPNKKADEFKDHWKSVEFDIKPVSSVIHFDFSCESGKVSWKINVGDMYVKFRSYDIRFFSGNTLLKSELSILEKMNRNTNQEDWTSIDPMRVTKIEVRLKDNF